MPAARKQISVEALVLWTYGAQQVIEITGRSLLAGEREVESFLPPVRRSTLDGLAAVGRVAELGCMVDNDHPIHGMVLPVHPDAESVHDLVLGLDWPYAAEIVRYGRGGEMPDHPGAPRFSPVWEHNGRRSIAKRIARYDFGLRCIASWCPIVLVNSDEAVAAAFRAYTFWWTSLEALWVALDGVDLRAHEVTGIEAAAPD